MKYKILQIIPCSKPEYVLVKAPDLTPKEIDCIKEQALRYKDENGYQWDRIVSQFWSWVIQQRGVSCWALVEQGKETHVVPMVPDIVSNELKPAEELENYLGLFDHISSTTESLALPYLKEILNG